MNKINYTKSQEEAINYFDTNLLISASAGSGKTQVLIEKVLKLIDKGVSLNNVLMLTFTTLASEEMRIKLEKNLKEKFEENKTIEVEKALNEIYSSDIGTIDSFCQKLVKKFYYKINLEPNFEIIDDNFAFYLKNLALDSIIEEYLQNNDVEFKRLTNIFIHSRSLNEFKNEIFSYFNFLTSKADRMHYIDEYFEKTNNENINENIVITFLKEDFLKNLTLLKDELKSLCFEAEKINSDKLLKIINEYLQVLNIEISSNEQFINTILMLGAFPTIRISKPTFEEDEIKEKLQKLSSKIKKYIKNIKDNFNFENIEELKREICENKKYLGKFFEIIKKFNIEYFKEKQKRNAYEFYDIEDFALILLKDSDILNYVNNKYKYIFVDEYQDTNDIQEEILNKICLKSTEIMVGDVKQSIYAFRECNPKIFLNKMQGKDKLINLNENFRSNKVILDFSNIIFSNLIRQENMSLSYKGNPFVAGKNFKENDENSLKHVEVVCLLKNREKNEDDESLGYKDKENILVLNSINELLKQKIFDEKTQTFRNLKYSDIAILSRKRGDDFKNLVNFLSDNNVPIKAKYYDKILKSFEINLIINYLKILSNFNNEIAVVSILKNIYNVSLSVILNLKNGNFYDNIMTSCDYRIKKFVTDFISFKELCFETNVKELTIEIIDKCNLQNLFLKHFGAISLEKVNVFLSSVLSEKMNLFEFLENLKNLDFDRKYEINKVTSEDSVTVDTFHASKGLEYNAVIIYGAGYKISDNRSKNLIYSSSLGTGICNFNLQEKSKNRSLIYSTILENNLKNDILEEMRLLYVALTRAKEFLVVIGSESEKNIVSTSNLFDFRYLHSYLSLIFSSNILDNNNFKINLINEDENIIKTEITDKVESENLELNFENFDKIFKFVYPYQNLKTIQLKSSVTALNEDSEVSEGSIYNISDFKMFSENLQDDDFLLIGNVYHKVFEMLKFNLQNIDEIKGTVYNLIESEILPIEAIKIVDFEKVLKINAEISKFVNLDSKIFKEKKFIMQVRYDEILKSDIKKNILVQGTIDLFIENDNEIILVDYKTSRIKNENKLIEKYRTQLNLYEKALLKSENFKDKPIRKFIASIYLSKLVEVI